MSTRGIARSDLGDRGGLEDEREAIALATQAGRWNHAAILRHDFALDLALWDGPAAGLEVAREAESFARSRGLAGVAETLQCVIADMLADMGEIDAALDIFAELAERLADEDLFDLVNVRSSQARLLALRGQAALAVDSLDWLEATSRASGTPEPVVFGLADSAAARAGLGQDGAAAELLSEIEAIPGIHTDVAYAAWLPEMVRTAIVIGDRQLAERLVDGVEPRCPVAEHALLAANAIVTESHGELQAAADAYADAAQRWEQFGVVPEQAFALLGQGRCLVGLERPSEAEPILRAAREIFERLRAAPTLAETDELLRKATALSS